MFKKSLKPNVFAKRKNHNSYAILICILILLASILSGCSSKIDEVPNMNEEESASTTDSTSSSESTTSSAYKETQGIDTTAKKSTVKPTPSKTTSTTKTTAVTTRNPTTTKKATTTAPSFPPTEPGHVHKFMHRTIEPNCMHGGYTKHTCACGYSYVDHETPKTGHVSTWRMVEASTPTEEGLIEHYCQYCVKVLRKEIIPKKKKPYNIDPRVKIEKARWTNRPVYRYKNTNVSDDRSWGEAPIIEILEDDSMQVTYYDKYNEKIVFILEQPLQDDHLMSAEISNGGSYVIHEFSPFS